MVTEVNSSKGLTTTSSKGRWEEDRGSSPPPGLARLRTPTTVSTEAAAETEEEVDSGLVNLTFVLSRPSLYRLFFGRRVQRG